MRHRPNVEGNHQRRRSPLRRHQRNEFLCGRAQYCKCVLARLAQFTIGIERNTRFEHRRVISRLAFGESEIGFAKPVERGHHFWPPFIPGFGEYACKLLEATPRNIGEQRVAIAKMPIRRGRANTRPARRVGEGEAGRPFLRDQLKRSAHQGFLETAVVIAARSGTPAPFHVNRINMSPAGASTLTNAARVLRPAADYRTMSDRSVARLRWSTDAAC